MLAKIAHFAPNRHQSQPDAKRFALILRSARGRNAKVVHFARKSQTDANRSVSSCPSAHGRCAKVAHFAPQYKKIVSRGAARVPHHGVANASWTLAKDAHRARQSLQ